MAGLVAGMAVGRTEWAGQGHVRAEEEGGGGGWTRGAAGLRGGWGSSLPTEDGQLFGSSKMVHEPRNAVPPKALGQMLFQKTWRGGGGLNREGGYLPKKSF